MYMFSNPTFVLLFVPAILSLVATAAPSGSHNQHQKRRQHHGGQVVKEHVVVITKTIGGSPAAPTLPSNDGFFDGDEQYNPYKGVKYVKKPSDGMQGSFVENPVVDQVQNPPAASSSAAATTETTESEDPPTQQGGGGDGDPQQPRCDSLGEAPAVSGDMKTVAQWYMNYHRCNHTDTNAIKWEASIAEQAQNCANQCKPHGDNQSPHCTLDVSNGQAGQTIAFPKTGDTAGLLQSIQQWYYGQGSDPQDNWNTLFTNSDELTNYDDEHSHLAIMIGRGFSIFGCAMHQCGSEVYSVCNYSSGQQKGGSKYGTPKGKPSIDDGDWQGKGQVPAGTQP